MEQDIDINDVSYTMPLESVDKSVLGTNTTITSTLSANTVESDVICIEVQCIKGHTCRFDIHKDDLVWELVEADEREMGTESHYEAINYKECAVCGSEIIITFHVWEYPDGVYNYSEIEIENGKLISKVNREMIQNMFHQVYEENHYDEE